MQHGPSNGYIALAQAVQQVRDIVHNVLVQQHTLGQVLRQLLLAHVKGSLVARQQQLQVVIL